MVVIGRDLTARSLTVTGWDAGSLFIEGPDGSEAREPLEGVLAVVPVSLLPLGEWAEPVDFGGIPVIVETNEGLRFFGGLVTDPEHDPGSRTGQFVLRTDENTTRQIEHDRLGRVVLDPWLRGRARPVDWSPGERDELFLANGDRLVGVLTGLGEHAVFEDQDGARTHEIGLASEVRVAQPLRGWRGPRLWLRTGEVLAGAHHESPDGTASGGAGTAASEVWAAWFGERSPVPLASLPRAEFAPLGGRRWAAAPGTGSLWSSPLGVGNLALDGPVRVVWEIPPGAGGFSAAARIGVGLGDADSPPGSWSEAVLTLRLERGGASELLGEYPLDVSTQGASIGVRLGGVGETGRRLVLEIDPGERGAVQDRVLLGRAFLVDAEQLR